MKQVRLVANKITKFNDNNNHHVVTQTIAPHVSINTLYSYGQPVISISTAGKRTIYAVYELYDYSRTTTKYVNQFVQSELGLDREEAKKYLSDYVKLNGYSEVVS